MIELKIKSFEFSQNISKSAGFGRFINISDKKLPILNKSATFWPKMIFFRKIEKTHLNVLETSDWGTKSQNSQFWTASKLSFSQKNKLPGKNQRIQAKIAKKSRNFWIIFRRLFKFCWKWVFLQKFDIYALNTSHMSDLGEKTENSQFWTASKLSFSKKKTLSGKNQRIQAKITKFALF